MSHFAKVKDGLVEQVIVAEPEFFETFVDTTPGTWIQTSYNTRGGVHYNPETGQPSEDQSKALRKNFPAVNWLYNHELDVFTPPKPFPSWVLDEQTGFWKSPINKPEDDKHYEWNESTLSWVESERKE